MTIRATGLAKLTRPVSASTYERARLFRLLDDKMQNTPTIWVTGPPGSGKTTLVADYTARRDMNGLWYQIDRGDNDPAAEFRYLTEAVRARGDEEHLPPFDPVYLGDLELFARDFFRELYRRTPPYLVLDNYQNIDGRNAHEVTLAAMEELPPGGRIFVLSHNDPPPQFAGLRARDQLDVIGWKDLQLTLEECGGIAAARNVRLSATELAELHTRTQGWAAALILLLQGFGTRAAAKSHAAGGTPQVIFHYVAKEIFEELAPPTQEFLLSVAYLPQVTLAMAEQIAPPGEAQSMLRHLALSEFLLTEVQPEPQLIVQLHPLLREFLLARAESQGSPAEISARQFVSARVLAEHGHHTEAAALLILLRHWDELAAYIHRLAETLLAQGLGQTLESWIRALPTERRTDDPWLQFWLGAARFPYSIDDARELFVAAYTAFSRSQPQDVRGLLATVNGMIEAIMYDLNDFTLLDPWIEAGTQLRAQLDEYGAREMQARLASNMFMAIALRQPEHPDFGEWRERTQQIIQAQGEPNLQITVHAMLALLYGWAGQFARGETLLEKARELRSRPEVSAVSLTKCAQAESMFYMLSGDGQQCMAAARTGLEIVAHSGVRLWNDTFLLNALYGALAEDDLESAAGFLQQVKARPTAERGLDRLMYAYGSAWHAALQGDSFIAHQQLRLAIRAATEFGLPFLTGVTGVALAQVLFDSGDQRGAQAEVLRAAALATKIRNRMLEFMTLMAQAHISLRSGQDAEGLNFLRAALALGRERGFVHYLWWHPQHVAYLCERALEANIETDYVRRLILRRNLAPSSRAQTLADWPWRYRLRVFGRFDFKAREQDSQARAKAGGTKPIELLQVLAALGGERVNVQRITDIVWPQTDGDNALRSLNTTLHRLRALLGDDTAILLQAGELSLNRRHFWLDSWAFEQASDEAAALPKAPSGAISSVDLLRLATQALTHYRGPLLADRGNDGDDAWVATARERYRSRLLRLLRLLDSTEKTLRQADFSNAVRELYQLTLVAEPVSDTITRLLMQSLMDAERFGEAIEAFQRLLATTTKPSPPTQQLYQRLLAVLDKQPEQ